MACRGLDESGYSWLPEATHQEAGVQDLQREVREAGLRPVERDTLYRPIERDGKDWHVR
jgi:2-iminoacetate synthase ThiH